MRCSTAEAISVPITVEDEGVRIECARLKYEMESMKSQELSYKAQIEKVSLLPWLPRYCHLIVARRGRHTVR